MLTYKIDVLISIHAPTRGATFFCRISITSMRISIHAPTRGATRKKTATIMRIKISIHAPTRGATFCVKIIIHINNYFNPRSYKRSDMMGGVRLGKFKRFQSTLLQEERQQKCTIFLMHLCNNYCIVSI